MSGSPREGDDRRIRLAGLPDFVLGGLQVSPSSREVGSGAGVQRLEPRMMKVLVALSGARGRVVSRDELIERCWDGRVVGDDAVNRVMMRLRQLSEQVGAGFRVETIPRTGYRLVLDEAPATDAHAEMAPPAVQISAPAPIEAPPHDAAAIRPRRIRGARVVAAGLAVVALLGAAALVLLSRRGDAPERVVVLDFVEGASAPEDFSHALGERIRAALAASQVRTLVQADASEFRGPGLERAARRHAVAFVLDGSVRREGDALQVRMQLGDARENQTLWSREYARSAREGAQLQEQVAAHAAEVLRCALIARRPGQGGIDPDTLSIFLRACDQIQRFDGAQEDMLAAGREVTRRAPGFSRGWSMLAMANAYASRTAPPERLAELRAATQDASARALALDASNEEAWLAGAVALPLLGAWAERARLIDRALALAPRSPQGLLLRAELYAETGRIAEALDLHRQAVAMEPLAASYWAGQIPLLGALGRMSELDDLRERLSRVWPHSPSAVFNRFNSHVYVGPPEVALGMMDAGEVPANPLLRDYLESLVAGDAGRRAEAVAAIAAAAREGRYDLPTAIALASASGNVDTAFELADRHFRGAAGEVRVDQPATGAGRFFLFVSSTRNMRRDPRFLQLVDGLGLRAYWRESGHWADFCGDPALPAPCRAP